MDTEPSSGESRACVWVGTAVAGIAVGLGRVVVGVTRDSDAGDTQPVENAPEREGEQPADASSKGNR